jgi:hypothetical protein
VTKVLVAEYEAAGVDRLVLLFLAFDEPSIAPTLDARAELIP